MPKVNKVSTEIENIRSTSLITTMQKNLNKIVAEISMTNHKNKTLHSSGILFPIQKPCKLIQTQDETFKSFLKMELRYNLILVQKNQKYIHGFSRILIFFPLNFLKNLHFNTSRRKTAKGQLNRCQKGILTKFNIYWKVKETKNVNRWCDF